MESTRSTKSRGSMALIRPNSALIPSSNGHLPSGKSEMRRKQAQRPSAPSESTRRGAPSRSSSAKG
eukprot:scaffold299279_cov39-Tisochrysis_lutea.AAC.4